MTQTDYSKYYDDDEFFEGIINHQIACDYISLGAERVVQQVLASARNLSCLV